MSKDSYREFCRQNDDVPVFLKDWWMDAVCDDNWDAVVIKNNDTVTAVMPYFLKAVAKIKS